jgi:dTDP-glucose 4,6-dehydratase
VNLDVLTYAGKEENIEAPFDNYTFVLGNICDAQVVTHVFNKYQPTMLIHFAAESHVDTSFGNSLKFTETNIMGTHVLLECARKYGNIKKFIHMSTDEVYGSVDEKMMCAENAMFKPSNPYSASKAAAEMLCNAYIMSFKLPIIIVRCNNAVSKYQHPEKLIPKCIECIQNGVKIPIHGAGNSKRTFIHTEDIARAFEIIAQKGKVEEIYNIGTTLEFSVIEVAEKILRILKPGEKVKDWIDYVPDRDFQDYRYSVDVTKLKQLGWKEEITFDESLKRMVEHKLSTGNSRSSGI